MTSILFFVSFVLCRLTLSIYTRRCSYSSAEFFHSTNVNDLQLFVCFCFAFPCRLTLTSYTRMSSNSSDEFFQATNHAEQTFRKMETYLQHKQLCDVLLIAGDHKIPAHRSAGVQFQLHFLFVMNIFIEQTDDKI